MLSLAFERNFVLYLTISWLSIMVWDILNNLRGDYRLLFQHHLKIPTLVYFISRLSVLFWAFIFTISITLPTHCIELSWICILFFIMGQTTTALLSYIRVCGVWHWNRFIVGLFGALLLFTVATSFTFMKSTKGVEVNGYCTLQIVVPELILASFVTALFNHTIIVLAITYGVCKSTIGDLTFRDGILFMLGKTLPTFSKAFIHDSQVCYIMVVGMITATLAWLYGWQDVPPTSAFRIALAPPYVILTNILVCRVYRNTKLGLYSKELLQSNNSTSKTHRSTNGMIPRNPSAVMPVQITVTHLSEYKTDSDYPSTRSQGPGDFLDFGMV